MLPDEAGAPGGEPILVDFRKYPDTPHWRFEMFPLGEDVHGTWLWAPAGTVAQRGSEPPIVFQALCVKVITAESFWTAIFNDTNSPDGSHIEVYVDIATPPRWSDRTVTMIDLDLDVARNGRGETKILDEDEFAQHRISYGYPDQLVAMARTTTAALYLAAGQRREPFGEVGPQWLETARNLVGAM